MSKKDQSKRRLLCELPPMSGAPCIELSGNREAVIEGSKGVLEYSTECVRVNTGGMVVTICGRELDLRCISSSSLIIEGFITGLEFAV